MVQVFLERYQFEQISVSRKFRLTENYTISPLKAVQNSAIKNFLITACDIADAQHSEQNLVIRDFLITARRGAS